MLHFIWLLILLVIITPSLRNSGIGSILAPVGLLAMIILISPGKVIVIGIVISVFCMGFMFYATRNKKEYELQKQKEKPINCQPVITHTDYTQNSNTKTKYATSSDIMSYSIEERMNRLGVSNLQELFNQYPQYITVTELSTLISAGLIRTYDDTVSKDGTSIDNENSEEWEDFEYEYDKEHKINHL